MMMLGYCRCSTAEQHAAGTSTMEEQERVIKGMAMAKGLGAYQLQIYSDPGVSGTIRLMHRPAGGEMYRDAKRGDVIVAAKLDRIFRNSLDAQLCYSEFQTRGIDLVLYDMGPESVTRGGMAHFFFSMLSAFATLERDRIAERMTEGKRAKRLKGGFDGGNAGYGYRVVGKGREAMVEPVLEEQFVLATIEDRLREHPNTSAPALARFLSEQGITQRNGRPFHRVQIHRLANRVADAIV